MPVRLIMPKIGFEAPLSPQIQFLITPLPLVASFTKIDSSVALALSKSLLLLPIHFVPLQFTKIDL